MCHREGLPFMSGQAFVFLKRERDKHDVRRRDLQFEVPSTLAFSLQAVLPVPLFSHVLRVSPKRCGLNAPFR